MLVILNSLIFIVLFAATAILQFTSVALVYQEIEPGPVSPGPFLFSIGFTLASYLCLGTLVFRESSIVQRLITTFLFVFMVHPVLFGLNLHENECPHPLDDPAEYLIVSYSAFFGNGPSILDVSGHCRVVILAESISGYLGLALIFAVLSSIFPTPTKEEPRPSIGGGAVQTHDTGAPAQSEPDRQADGSPPPAPNYHREATTMVETNVLAGDSASNFTDPTIEQFQALLATREAALSPHVVLKISLAPPRGPSNPWPKTDKRAAHGLSFPEN